MQINKNFVQAVSAALILVTSCRAFAAEPGQTAPLCALTALGSTEAFDLRQFRGKVLLVDFWASWCATCAKSFPFLNAMDREYRDQGLQIVGVNLDDNVKEAKAFLEKRPASFALASDSGGQCPRDFGVQAMPTSYLVDRDGRIRHVLIGFRSGETGSIRNMVENLLAEKPPAGPTL